MRREVIVLRGSLTVLRKALAFRDAAVPVYAILVLIGNDSSHAASMSFSFVVGTAGNVLLSGHGGGQGEEGHKRLGAMTQQNLSRHLLTSFICVVETKTLEQIEEGCVDAMKDGPVALEDVSLEDPVESEQMKAFKEKWIHRLGSRHAYEEFLIDARVAALLPSEQQAIVDREMDYESIWDYGESDEDHVQTLVEEIIAETA